MRAASLAASLFVAAFEAGLVVVAVSAVFLFARSAFSFAISCFMLTDGGPLRWTLNFSGGFMASDFGVPQHPQVFLKP